MTEKITNKTFEECLKIARSRFYKNDTKIKEIHIFFHGTETSLGFFYWNRGRAILHIHKQNDLLPSNNVELSAFLGTFDILVF